MTAKNYKYFNYARSVAELSDYHKNHIGCIAVLGNKILSVGFSSKKDHPLQKHYNQYRKFENTNHIVHKLHAEIHCLSTIRNMDINWSKVDLYIYRIRKDIGMGLSRPCPACMAMIRDLGITNIFYTGNGSYIYEKLQEAIA